MKSAKQLVFGYHAVAALLYHQSNTIIRLCVQKDRRDKKTMDLITHAQQQGIPFAEMTGQALDKLTQATHHQGIVAVCHQPHIYTEKDIASLLTNISLPIILILDGVQDPHNLGACFRSADAAGAHMILIPKDNAASITPIVSKVASGATATLPLVQVTNLVRAIEALKEAGIWVYGAAQEAEQPLYQLDMCCPLALVLGAEGKGLRRLTREHCDGLVKIPMQGTVESLNVAVAAGIFLFEVVRQRMK